MVLMDEILAEKYEVYLDETNYRWNEYDDWTNNKPKLLNSFKTREEAERYLEVCERHKVETQKKYRGTISYRIQPMYLRHEVHTVWSLTKEPQADIDAFFRKLVGTSEPKRPYTG